MSWVDDAVAAEAAWMEDLLVELVAARDEDGGQAVMARALADCDLQPVDVPLDAEAIRADPHHSPFSWSVEGKRNVVATWPAADTGGRSLILNGHVDVVPPASEALWSSPPFAARREGDWIYGRGAGDMKAGLVAMTGAVRGLRRAGVQLRGDLQLQSVVEEECTGNGTLQCLLAGAHADACVITEPHHDHFTVAQVGVLWFHVDVRGVPGHAARGGRGAFDAALDVLAKLRRLEAELNADPPPPYDAIEHPINLNPGVVTAGDWPSTVPAECTLSCRLAIYPGHDPAALRRRVEEVVAPYEVRYDGFACEGSVVAHDEDVVVALAGAYAAVHGERPALRATTATTDARHFVRRGIPAICYGPLAERIHGIDERVSLRSMVEVARVLARFVLDWCGESNDARVLARSSGGEAHGRS
jgi:acetylornithine deacetylase